MTAMKRDFAITHQFVESVPDILQEGVLYVSVTFGTAIHKCFCGCGTEIVTPLSPTDWRLTYDGRTVTLEPSIGNWGIPCQSHYWIRNNRVQWAAQWSREQIQAGRKADAVARQRYLDSQARMTASPEPQVKTAKPAQEQAGYVKRPTLWQRFINWLSS